MRHFSELAGRDDLEWNDTSGATRAFELRAGRELVAGLRFGISSDPTARGTSGDGVWLFERSGYFPAKAIVREPGGRVVATAMDDTIDFVGGSLFRARGGFWGPRIVLTRKDGASVAWLQQHRGRRPTHVDIPPGGASLSELPVLILLAWYIPVVWLWSDD